MIKKIIDADHQRHIPYGNYRFELEMHLKKLVHIPASVVNAKRRRMPNKVTTENSQNAMLYHYFYIDGIHVNRIDNERTNEANRNATHVMKNRRTHEREMGKNVRRRSTFLVICSSILSGM